MIIEGVSFAHTLCFTPQYVVQKYIISNLHLLVIAILKRKSNFASK